MARSAGRDSPQLLLQGYGCPGRLYPRERSQGWVVLVARPAQLRGVHRLLSARRTRCQDFCRVEIRLPQVRLVLLWPDRAEKSHHCRLPQALRPDGRNSQDAGPRYGPQPLPIRHGRRMDLGAGFGRALLAHHRRPGRRKAQSIARLLFYCAGQRKPCQLCRPRPLERSRLYFDRRHRRPGEI